MSKICAYRDCPWDINQTTGGCPCAETCPMFCETYTVTYGTSTVPNYGLYNGESLNGFSVGEYIIYQNGDQYELRRIKSLRPDGAFVAYHEGETGAKTPYDCMHKLVNRYVIEKTSLGGSYFD